MRTREEVENFLAMNRREVDVELVDYIYSSRGIKCEDCDDVGYTKEYDSFGNPDEIECEFCHTEPNSMFNVARGLGHGT